MDNYHLFSLNSVTVDACVVIWIVKHVIAKCILAVHLSPENKALKFSVRTQWPSCLKW